MVVDNLIEALKNRPNDFICDNYVLIDGSTKYQYWVANTVFSGGIYRPYEMNFGFFQSLRFHSALNKWKAWLNINANTK